MWRRDATSDPVAATVTLRAARNDLFRDHPQSPIPDDQRAAFRGLAYFDYDPAYRFTALVEPTVETTDTAAGAPTARAPLLQLPSSGAEAFSFRRIGLVHLDGPLAGASLPLFWMEGYAGGLFLPFRDATSGSATYGAGRYLMDSAKAADLGGDWRRGELLLDFNLAYHPSCAYDPKWSCPLAPPQSRLAMAVPVGERLR